MKNNNTIFVSKLMSILMILLLLVQPINGTEFIEETSDSIIEPLSIDVFDIYSPQSFRIGNSNHVQSANFNIVGWFELEHIGGNPYLKSSRLWISNINHTFTNFSVSILNYTSSQSGYSVKFNVTLKVTYNYRNQGDVTLQYTVVI